MEASLVILAWSNHQTKLQLESVFAVKSLPKVQLLWYIGNCSYVCTCMQPAEQAPANTPEYFWT